MSNSGLILLILIIAVISTAGLLILQDKNYIPEDENIFCTQDAKLCSDGSYVGRVGPNCEFAVCPDNGGDDFKTSGTVVGRVSIGPLCPVEPCFSDQPSPYISRQLIFTPQGGGRPVDLPFYVDLKKDGSYSAELPESNYEVTLSDCDYMGCRYSLPKMIFVKANETQELDIDIDTGIR
ncbi:MAG: hypothetical protein Q8Q06_00050 [bacterium]|nr:hypothetical protein [bacterium]